MHPSIGWPQSIVHGIESPKPDYIKSASYVCQDQLRRHPFFQLLHIEATVRRGQLQPPQPHRPRAFASHNVEAIRSSVCPSVQLNTSLAIIFSTLCQRDPPTIDSALRLTTHNQIPTELWPAQQPDRYLVGHPSDHIPHGMQLLTYSLSSSERIGPIDL